MTQLFGPEFVHFQEEQMQPIQQEIEKAYFVDNREFKVLSRWEWRRRDSMQVWGVVLEIGRLDDRQILMASAIEPLRIWMTRTRLGFDRIESNGNQKICAFRDSVFFFPLCFHVNVSVTEAIPARTALWGSVVHGVDTGDAWCRHGSLTAHPWWFFLQHQIAMFLQLHICSYYLPILWYFFILFGTTLFNSFEFFSYLLVSSYIYISFIVVCLQLRLILSAMSLLTETA